jgi:hypothetical protein
MAEVFLAVFEGADMTFHQDVITFTNTVIYFMTFQIKTYRTAAEHQYI